MICDEKTRVEDYLAAWDSGQVVQSIAMGGLGPGYEQAIQVLMIEILRALNEIPCTHDTKTINQAVGDAMRQHEHLKGWKGLSGAQVCSAKKLAHVIRTNGIASSLAMVGGDRHISISRHFVEAPSITPDA